MQFRQENNKITKGKIIRCKKTTIKQRENNKNTKEK